MTSLIATTYRLSMTAGSEEMFWEEDGTEDEKRSYYIRTPPDVKDSEGLFESRQRAPSGTGVGVLVIFSILSMIRRGQCPR